MSVGFSKKEYWSGLPCPPRGDLLHPGIELASLASPALQVDFLPTEPPGKPTLTYGHLTWLLQLFLLNYELIFN